MVYVIRVVVSLCAMWSWRTRGFNCVTCLLQACQPDGRRLVCWTISNVTFMTAKPDGSQFFEDGSSSEGSSNQYETPDDDVDELLKSSDEELRVRIPVLVLANRLY